MKPLARVIRGLFLLKMLFIGCGAVSAVWGAAELVSVSTGNEPSFFSPSGPGKTDGTGRFVAFASVSSELASNDQNNASDIFLRDRALGVTTRVSMGLDGVEADSDSIEPTVSADGRWIAYISSATNLVPNDTNAADDVFVFDRTTGKTTRANVPTNGAQADGGATQAAISGNGRFVVFVSSATNLVPNDGNALSDVFVRDLQSKVTTRVSLRPDGTESVVPPNLFQPPSISHDGRWVTFNSSATDLVAGDTNGFADVFVHDRQTQTTIIASRTSAGVLGNGDSVGPVLSADGQVVAFGTSAPNLTGGNFNVVLKDLRTGVASVARPAATFSFTPSLSADGRRVALVTRVGAADEQVEVVDRATGLVFAPARLPNGGSAGTSHSPSLSADGRVVVFSASNDEIVPADQNGQTDVFARPLHDTIEFSSTVFRASESAGSVPITVQREGVLNGAVSVQYAISAASDTAVAGTDYAPTTKTGTLTWGAGDLTNRTVNIPLIDTPAADGYRAFTIALTSPTGGAALGRRSAQVVIADTESDPVENRVGHGLKITRIEQRGTNWDTGTFRALFTIHNPAPLPSFPGFIELQFDGNVLENVNFDAVPAGGELVVDAVTNVGLFPDGDVYALLYETTPAGAVLQDSAFAAGFVDNGTAPPSGGTTNPDVGLKAPGFTAVTVKSVTVEGDGVVNEGTSKQYTAKVTLSDGSTLENVTPAWRTTAFAINGAGLFTAGDVAADKSVTLSATVVRNGVATTGSRKITVKNVPAPPAITSALTAFASTAKPFVYKIVARHEPTSFAASGLPAGLALNSGTGAITGTVTVTGEFPVQISATNALGTDTETLVLTAADPSPLTVNIVGTGTVKPDLNGQLLDVGRTYKLVAKPGRDQLFAGWSNGVTSNALALAFVMVPNLVLDATFVPNPFLTRAGGYVGLVRSVPATHDASGLLAATITPRGRCTDKLTIGGKASPFRTQLLANGTSPVVTVRRRGLPEVAFTLELDVINANGALTGELKSGALEAEITAHRRAQNPAALAGYYTMVLPGPEMPDASGATPDGAGFATVIVAANGKVRLKGVMGDGSKFSQSSAITMEAEWPFYVPLYRGGGSVLGPVAFAELAGSDFSGDVVWFKPEQLGDSLYPAGWPAGLERALHGARYTAPPVLAGLSAADADGNAMIEFSGGGLSGSLVQILNVAINGTVTPVQPLQPKFECKVTVKKGLFKGSVLDPIAGQILRFSGAIQKKRDAGFGFFPGTSQRSGHVILHSNDL